MESAGVLAVDISSIEGPMQLFLRDLYQKILEIRENLADFSSRISSRVFDIFLIGQKFSKGYHIPVSSL